MVGLFFLVGLMLVPWSAFATTFNALQFQGVFVVPQGASGMLLRGASALKVLSPWLGALTTGAEIARLALQDSSGGLVNLAPSTYAPYAAPDGWVDSETPPVTAPASGATRWCTSSNAEYRFCHLTQELGCKALSPRDYQEPWVYTYSGDPNLCVKYSEGDTEVVGYIWTLKGCPLGYVESAGSCSLVDAYVAQWPSDGVATMAPSAEGWASHRRDPDAGPTFGTVIDLAGVDEFGNPYQFSVARSAEGGLEIRSVTQGEQGTVPVVGENTLSLAPGTETAFTAGTTNYYLTTNVTLQTYTGWGGGGGTSVTFPKDYAREATLGEIRDSLVSPVVPPNPFVPEQGAVDVSVVAPGLPSAPSWFGYGGGSCAPLPSFAVLGSTVSLSGDWWCPLVEDMRAVLGWMLYVMTAVYVWHKWQTVEG